MINMCKKAQMQFAPRFYSLYLLPNDLLLAKEAVCQFAV